MLVFSTNCTLPPTTTNANFITSPNARGTWDILWSALTTLFLCTWSVQHGNIPKIDSSTSTVKVEISRLLKRLMLMLVMLVVPEFLLLKAVSDFESARALAQQMGWRAKRAMAQWSVVHSYFLNMGGVVVTFDGGLEEVFEEKVELERPLSRYSSSALAITNINDEPTVVDLRKEEHGSTYSQLSMSDTEKALSSTTQPEEHHAHIPEHLTPHQKKSYLLVIVREKYLPASSSPNTTLVRSSLTHLKSRISSGSYDHRSFVDVNNIAINLVRLRSTSWALDGAQFIYALEHNLVASIPSITSEEIADKSKSDFLAKFLACTSVTWTIVQICMRWGKGMPTSQLEVVVVAFAFLTLFTYVLNWHKPQDIERPIFIPALRHPSVEELIELADLGPSYITGFFAGFHYNVPEHALHSNFGEEGLDGGVLSWAGGLAGALAFGALHCAAWRFEFPTGVEGSLWKGAALVTMGIPVLYAMRAVVMERLEKGTRGRWGGVVEDRVMPALGMLAAGTYTVSRCFLLVETFRSLGYLVPGTFRS